MRKAYLLLPALQLLDEVVVPLGDLGKLRLHPPLKVDEILPGLQSIARVLVPLTNNLIKVSHRNLGHQRLLDGSAENGLQPAVAANLLANMVHDCHNGILVPPFGVLNRLNLTSHHNDLASRDKLSAAICGPQMLRNTRRCDITVKRLSETGHKLVALVGVEGGWWA